MKPGRRIILNVPNGTADMALALEMPLLVNGPTSDQSSLSFLIERAASGDKAAFEQVMINSEQRVMAMTWRMLGNEADARDASQEVFLRVYKYLGRFRRDQDFFAWLYGITVNVCRDFLKKRQNHTSRFVSFGEDSSVAYEVADEHANAEQMLVQTQQQDLIAKAMGTLPFKERASIVLRDIEGLSTDEVARIMKSSATTVRSQISSARKKIRIYCQQHQPGFGEGRAR
ncbi:MAG TPA: RNA polymerase sigma factor [Pyrinomonadaceae bacterium]|nr:RNA polymerase sigma factor [Pyrinomonadaceae bacterium]